MKRVILIGLLAPDYMICLANALAEYCDLFLILSERNLLELFPDTQNVHGVLRDQKVLDPAIDLQIIHYPHGKYLTKLKITRELVRLCRGLEPDIIHYQSGGEPWLLLGMPFLRSFPLVATIHDAAHHPGDQPAALFLEIKNFLLAAWAAQLIVHGEEQFRILKNHFKAKENKLNIVQIGPINIYQKLYNEKMAAESHTILFFGRIHEYKGLSILLKAMPLVAKEIPDIRLIVAGSGECPELLPAVTKNPAWFEVVNRFIRADEVAFFMNKSAVVILPYIAASQSAVLPLAASFARPVIASSVGSIPEVIDDGKTGVLVPPGDSLALAQAIIEILRTPDRSLAMGKAAKQKLNTDLSWKNAAQKTALIYEKALHNKFSMIGRHSES